MSDQTKQGILCYIRIGNDFLPCWCNGRFRKRFEGNRKHLEFHSRGTALRSQLNKMKISLFTGKFGDYQKITCGSFRTRLASITPGADCPRNWTATIGARRRPGEGGLSAALTVANVTVALSKLLVWKKVIKWKNKHVCLLIKTIPIHS